MSIKRIFHTFLILTLIIGNLIIEPDRILATSETRYMRSDTQSINGLSAYQLGTSQTSSGLSTTYTNSTVKNGTVYFGIRVWKRNSSGTETEITSGTPVAQVNRTVSAPGPGIQSSTWSATSTSLSTTDSIVIRVYMQVNALGWDQGSTAANFTTEQIGATSLDNVTWTVYYYTSYATGNKYTTGIFYWGTSTYNSRIENFTHSISTLTVGTTGTQVTNLVPGSPNAHIGGAFTMIHDNGTSNVTSITISQTGSVSSANLTDLILFYKQEATCSTTIPGDATQFNSTPGTFSSGSSTVTGTMSVGTSQVCVYVRLDVGTGASATETIEIQITNPSTQVLVSAGIVAPATAVAISGTTTIIAGYLSLSIVNSSDTTVSSPTVDFESKTFSFEIQESVGVLGVTEQKIKVVNFTTTATWTLSMAATGGNTSLWQSGSYTYDYNGTQSQGRLQGNHSTATITPGSGCTNTALSLQSAAYFVQGSVDSINLLIAGSGANTICYWYLTGVEMVQELPASQPVGNYSLSMTLTLI